MKHLLLISFFTTVSLNLFSQSTTLAFGSCGRQTDPLTIFDTIVKHHPTHFLFLGDNIYGDTRDTAVLRAKYELLGSHTSYQHLKENTTIWATWDDHDFGENDAGKNYPLKQESARIFYDFFEEPLASGRRQHEGIYHSYFIKDSNLTIQVIMLDTRTFRDDLLPYDNRFASDSAYQYGLDYSPNPSKKVDLLGQTQWNWLAQELKKPADVRVVCTSIQFGHTYNGYESWTNFPQEQKRFLKLIRKTKANGVLFISGDVHYAEISEIKVKKGYTLYDFTSSGLSSKWHLATPNAHRIQGPIMENNFGLLHFTQGEGGTQINFELFTDKNEQVMQMTIPLSDLQF